MPNSRSENQEANQKAYDAWSATYDHAPNPTVFMDDRFFPAFYENSVRGKAALEMGCGTGRHTVRLSALAASLSAVEPSAGMLALAQKKTRSPVDFVAGDFFTAPFPAGKFEVLVESLVLEHVASLDAFFARAAELLAPRAEIFLSELHPARLAAGTQAHFEDPVTKEKVFTKSFAHPAEEFAAAAARAGFRLVETQEHAGDDALAAAGHDWAKYRGRPMIQLWRFAR